MCTRSFQIKKIEKKLAVVEKELQQARKDNQTLAQYINTKRKKEEDQKNEEAQKKEVEEAGKKVK
jgi:ABC-type branched-subunit amino acid transport system ATPase component